MLGTDVGRVPKGWIVTTLDQVCDVNGGIQKQAKRRPVDNKFPFLRVANVGRGTLDLSEIHEVELFDGEIERFRLKAGDLLVVEGNGSPDQIGRAATWKGAIPDAVHQNHLIRVRPTAAVDPKFLELLWNSPLVALQLMSVAQSSSGLYTLSTAKLKRVQLALPPLTEQHRIVEALEEQLPRLDAASAVLNKVRSQGSALQKQMVSAVISGRRRAAGSGDDADDFLSQVDEQVARVAGKKRWAQVRNPEVTELYEIPAGWCWRTLGSLCLDIQYGTSAKTSPKANVDDVPVIRMGNIRGGELDLGDLKFLPASHSDIAKSILRDGDLLFNRTNSAELVGKSAVFRKEMGSAVYASYLIRCRFAEGVDPDWVNAVVNSNFGRRYIASVVTQQVGQANVNSAKMALMPIPVPPPAEQREALKVLRDWESALTRPQLAAGAAVKRTEGLKSAILRRAFNGDLVPQDPSDEPAARLLARIAAEREAAMPVLKAAKRAARPRKAIAAQAAAATKTAPAPTPAPSASVQQELFDQ
ncbi:restriction endonuclease subunit S [Streptomyces niveus]|uniref:restriction endonuclease subunit S n=1 Tax=Streptomyces niveus TaxID=193462 RepID=UPI00342047FF